MCYDKIPFTLFQNIHETLGNYVVPSGFPIPSDIPKFQYCGCGSVFKVITVHSVIAVLEHQFLNFSYLSMLINILLQQ